MIVNFNDIRYGRNLHVYPVRFKNGEETFRADNFYEGKKVLLVCSSNTMDKDDFYSLLQVVDCLSKFCMPYIYMPYFFGCRQHRDNQAEHSTIDALLNIRLLYAAGAEQIYTLDMHSPDTQVYNISPFAEVAKYLYKEKIPCNVVIAPDHGALARAKTLAGYIGAEVATYKKIRYGSDVSLEFEKSCGVDLKGKDCIIVDDIIDSGSTLLKVIDDARSRGAQIKYVYATHCLMTNGNEEFESRQVKVLGVTGDPDDYVYYNDYTTLDTAMPKIIEKEFMKV